VLSLLALVGVAAAVGLGLVVNEISGDSIGLSAEPLRAGEPLAPAAARDDDRRGRGRGRGRGRSGERRDRRAAPSAPSREAGDDKGGLRPAAPAGTGGGDGFDDRELDWVQVEGRWYINSYRVQLPT
jgi:hypothetical protein